MAIVLCRSGLVLRTYGKNVLILARDVKILGDVFAGPRHRIDAVSFLHQRIDEVPADRLPGCSIKPLSGRSYNLDTEPGNSLRDI